VGCAPAGSCNTVAAAGARRDVAAGPLHVIKPHGLGSFLGGSQLEEVSAGIFVAP
jgi:hypothetical protein